MIEPSFGIEARVVQHICRVTSARWMQLFASILIVAGDAAQLVASLVRAFGCSARLEVGARPGSGFRFLQFR